MSEEDNFNATTALDLVHDAYLAVDEPDLSDTIGDLSLDQKCHVLGFVEAVSRAARDAKRQIAESIVKELGANNSLRIGDNFYRAKQTTSFVTTDTDTLIEFLGDQWPDALDLKRPKIGALKRIAKDRGLSEQSLVDTIGEYRPSGSPVSVIPYDRAPKYLQKLSDGQTAYPLPKGELE